MSEIYQPYSRSNAGYNPFNSFHYYMHHFKQQPFCFKLSNLCVHDNILEKLESKGALLLFKSCMDHRNKKKDKREMVVTQYFWPESFRINDVVSSLFENVIEVDVLTRKPN